MADLLPDGAYGSLSEQAYRQLLAVNPVWVHATPRANFDRIAVEGLLPWDEVGRANAQDTCAEVMPRPGCVYLCAVSNADHAWVMAGDREDLAYVAVDMRGVARQRILPDEDPWSGVVYGLYEPAEHGIEPYSKELHRNGGAWADTVKLGSQPGIVELAVADEKICVRGRIAPELLFLEPLDDGPYAASFWMRELNRKICSESDGHDRAARSRRR